MKKIDIDKIIKVCTTAQKARVNYGIANMFGIENLTLSCLNLIKNMMDIKDEK